MKRETAASMARYELKYQISSDILPLLIHYLSFYCDLDHYAKMSNSKFYTINSLYLDTPRQALFRGQNSNLQGFSCFRIRSYGQNPTGPYFFESKQKFGDFCVKRRAKMDISSLHKLQSNSFTDLSFCMERSAINQDLCRKIEEYDLRPFVLTRYERMAFFSLIDPYTRVTIDKNLQLMEENKFNVNPQSAVLRNYDHFEIFDNGTTEQNFILEIKCEKKIPLWLIELIKRFGLKENRISKFQTAIMDVKQYQSAGSHMVANPAYS